MHHWAFGGLIYVKLCLTYLAISAVTMKTKKSLMIETENPRYYGRKAVHLPSWRLFLYFSYGNVTFLTPESTARSQIHCINVT